MSFAVDNVGDSRLATTDLATVVATGHQTNWGSMIIGVPKEAFPGERRVALVPVVVPNLSRAGFQVQIEVGAGVSAGYPDAD